jgi:LPS export ABC transporter permease LptF
VRLDRYLLREIIPPFFVALLAFLVFISLELILSLSEALFARGVSASLLLRLLSYKLPYILTLAMPAGALLATFLALARLASDRELLAFQALGYSLRRLILPFLAFGFFVSLGSFALSEFTVPAAETQYRRELLALLYRGPAPLIQENVFFRGSEGELFYVERYSGDRVEGVVVYDLAGKLYPRSSFPAVITAKEGTISSGRLFLRQGRVLHFDSAGRLAEMIGFEELSLEVGERMVEAILGSRTPSEMSARELWERIELLEKSGQDVRGLWVEFHGKLAVAAAALVFVLFGAPLGAILGHRGRALGMVVGFLLAAGAQALFLWARTLARRGFLPPFLGGWLPHLVFGVLGLFLFLGADRLRFRGLLLLLLLGTVGLAAPPFQELHADELVIGSDGKSFQAVNAKVLFSEYTLTAQRLSLVEEEHWVLNAEEVEVELKEGKIRAKVLLARLSSEGELREAVLQDFSGETRFSGPEKEETLLFSAQEGVATFEKGELVRVEGKGVVFTTCPCREGAPYLVFAEDFLLYPERWLFVRNLRVESFGYPVVWLPLYAARLGEEGVPFLPEFGRTGLGWFLRWSIPWSLGEGTVGAVLLTWYPEAGRVDPGLQAIWRNGSLFLTPERSFLRFQGELFGEKWQAQGRLDASGLLLSASGKLRGWSVSLQAGLAEAPTGAYARLPELTLSRALPLWGGELGLRVGFGRYREEGVEGWRAGISGSWEWSANFWAFTFQFPLNFGVDQYPKSERLFLALNPSVSLGNLSLWYQGQVGLGRSPFAFDATPAQSQVGISLRAAERNWSQGLSLGWDFLASLPSGRFSLKGPGFSADLSFQPIPFRVIRAKWERIWRGENWAVSLRGGFSGSFEDLLLRGSLDQEGWSLEGGLRLGFPGLFPKRLALSASGKLGPEWSWAVFGEFDFLSMDFVQLELSVFHVFSGCLRVGLSLYLTGFRLSLDVPAFPEAKVQFAPLDEGLRFFGL